MLSVGTFYSLDTVYQIKMVLSSYIISDILTSVCILIDASADEADEESPNTYPPMRWKA